MSGDIFGSKANYSQTNKGPWDSQAGYLTNAFNEASNLYQQGPYKGPFIGAQSPYTLQGQQALVSGATTPGSALYEAPRMLGDTLSGKYLNPQSNPFFQDYANDALGLVRSQFAKQYGGGAGQNLENSGYREQLTRDMTNAALGTYSNVYNQERQNQMAAAGMAPGVGAANANALMMAGQSQEQRSQMEANAQQQAYNAPWQNLQNYYNIVNGQYGGTQQSPYYTNPLASLMGLGLGGLGMYNMGQTAGLWGAGAGAGAGAGGLAAGAGDLMGTLGPLALA